MMNQIISEHKSITEVYSELCIRLRDIQREVQEERAICQHCGHPKSRHCNDGRCDIYATSRHFHNIRTDEFERVQKALGLIEELRAV